MKVLSIIIPTYNMEKYLDRCLSSLILDQKSMSKIEVLVINDGSKDASSAIAHNYADLYPDTFVVIDKENGHYGSCVNFGLSITNGKYVKVLDADDWFETTNLAGYVAFLEKNDVDLALTRSLAGAPDKLSEYHSCSLPPEEVVSMSSMIYSNLSSLPHQCLTYRTAMLREIDYKQSEGIPYTDLEWDLFPMRAVHRIVYYPQVLYIYYLGRESQSVAPVVHASEMIKDIYVVENGVSYYEKFKDASLPENNNVMLKIIGTNVERIYFHYLINLPHLLNNDDLRKFDRDILSMSPEVYHFVENAVEYRKYTRFRYIRCWRRHQSRNTLEFFLFDMGVKVGKLLK